MLVAKIKELLLSLRKSPARFDSNSGKHFVQPHELFAQGIYVERMPIIDRLQRLADSLKPVKTKFELVRIGGDNDGGYLVPDDLEGIQECFSPGVDLQASFEMDILSKKGIGSHLADYSVDRAPMNFVPLSFTKKYIGPNNNDTFITLEEWVAREAACGAHNDLLLQMDIEGGEFMALLSASDALIKRFRIIVVEIHKTESWGAHCFLEVVEAFFEKLLRHFHLVHNHPNNCCGIVNLNGFFAPRVFELSFLRKDRSAAEGYATNFPHPLDAPNIANRDDLILPANWY